MKIPTYQEYLDDRSVLAGIKHAAAKERAEAIHAYVFTPLVRLFKKLVRKPAAAPATRYA